MEKKKVIVLTGPTASGKTSLGIELAKKIDGEVISAESMQVYKTLDVGTAKVSAEEQKEVKHHLIDICNMDEEFSVASFKSLCYDKINDIIKRKKVPIIVGGTGLYINSVIYNMNFSSQEDDMVKEYRQYLYDLASKNGNMYVYDMLKKVDEDSIKNIHPNNLKRVVRALEMAKFSGKKKSEHIEEEKERIEKLKDTSQYEFFVYYIELPRDILYDRINLRVEKMFQDERMLKEARLIYDLGDRASRTCRQAIGYKELFPYFEGIKSLDECKEELKRATRKYAKRQITWFNNKLNKKNIDGTNSYKENVDIIINDLS